MLFAIDAGNTNITIGLFDGEKLEKTFRMTTGISRTSDEYGVFLLDWLRMRQLSKDVIDEVIIASVVPKIMHSLVNGIKKYFGITPLIVDGHKYCIAKSKAARSRQDCRCCGSISHVWRTSSHD